MFFGVGMHGRLVGTIGQRPDRDLFLSESVDLGFCADSLSRVLNRPLRESASATGFDYVRLGDLAFLVQQVTKPFIDLVAVLVAVLVGVVSENGK